jgi:hypothetical protein
MGQETVYKAEYANRKKFSTKRIYALRAVIRYANEAE